MKLYKPTKIDRALVTQEIREVLAPAEEGA